MPQDKFEKWISCTHWYKNEIWPHFTKNSLFHKITTNVVVKKISNDDAPFEGAICKDCSLTLYSSI